MQKILCIEDDPTFQELISATLDEYVVVIVASLARAEQELKTSKFAAILVDIELPDGDGIRFLSTLQEDQGLRGVPVLVLSGHGDIQNKVTAFSLGADDFVTKPFDPRELKARVKSKLLRKSREDEVSRTKKLGNLLIDLDRQKTLLVAGTKEEELPLTFIEFKILVLLTKRIEKVYSREQILDAVWGQTNITDRTVDSHVAHLRQKLKRSSVIIETVKSSGYRAVLGGE